LFGGGNGVGCVVRQQRRYFQRHPSVHAVRLVEDGSKQVGGPRDVFKGQVEKEILAGFSPRQGLANHVIVGRAVLDGVIEDRRIRSQTRHRQFINVPFECAVVQQVAGDVVEPEALAQIMELLRSFHGIRFSLHFLHSTTW
jgi:hypothetical protein